MLPYLSSFSIFAHLLVFSFFFFFPGKKATSYPSSGNRRVNYHTRPKPTGKKHLAAPKVCAIQDVWPTNGAENWMGIKRGFHIQKEKKTRKLVVYRLSQRAQSIPNREQLLRKLGYCDSVSFGATSHSHLVALFLLLHSNDSHSPR